MPGWFFPGGAAVIAVAFDGATDNLFINSNLAGSADGKIGLFSTWFRVSNVAAERVFFNLRSGTNPSRFAAGLIQTTGEIYCIGRDSGGATVLNVVTTVGYNDGLFHCVTVAFDLANSSNRVFLVDGVTVPVSWLTYANTAIDFNSTSGFTEVGTNNATNYMLGDLANLYFTTPAAYVNPVGKFVNFRSPVPLGDNGSIPTGGTVPLVCLGARSTLSWNLNQGSGGGFNVNGGPLALGQLPVQAPAYAPNGVSLGANVYATRGAGLTGAADGKQLTVALAFKMNVTTDQNFSTITTATTLVVVGFDSNGFYLFGTNAAGTVILDIHSGALSTGTWYSILASIDLADVSKRFIYVNDVAASLTVATYTNDNLDFTGTNASIGAFTSGNNKINGNMSDLWINLSYTDFSVVANRRKFNDAAGALYNKGFDGSAPTGSVPLVFQSGATGSWHTNKGSGGGFTIATGSFGTSSPLPPGA